MLKALLVDIDGTLYDVEPCHVRGMERAHQTAHQATGQWKTLEEFETDYKTARGELHARIKGTAASHCRLLYFKLMLEKQRLEISLPLAMKFHDAYWQGYFSEMKLFPDCVATLEWARREGLKIAWVTNFTTERQIEKLLRLGLDGRGLLITSEESGKDKPEPEPFLLAMKKLGVKPQECLMIGDDWKSDIVPAAQLGMTRVWLCGAPPELSDAGTLKATDWSQVRAHLTSFLKSKAKLG